MESAMYSRWRATDDRDRVEYHMYKGVPLPSHLDPKDMDDIQDFTVRDDDVFIITYPKSGTAWLQRIVSLLHFGGDVSKTDRKEQDELVPYFEQKVGDSATFRKLTEVPSPRMMKSHLHFSHAPVQLTQGKGKVIYVARNPKDLAVSYYHFHFLCSTLKTPTSWEQFLQEFVNGEVSRGAWHDHVLGWWKHQDLPNVLFLRYEDLQKNTRKEVEKVAEFLQWPVTPEVIDKVVEQSTFQKMATNPATNKVAGKGAKSGVFDFSKGTYFRKGVVGDWKSLFSDEQSQWFDTFYREKLGPTGLHFDFE
ncbi:sulfotransferase 1A3-like isoform X2 [Branchiostoma floridae]|uniref:Sulfotransferase n=1 Tax=Branchiostoma floridae TaxID=7739 RepID=A0A9J7HHQ4_BRAFL|nr:sulfotransferase 1A3-like isoform X2 [Branchiostoma floridae]